MARVQFALLGKRRFLPLFVAQFLGAFNDNFFKTAIVMLITFSVAADKTIYGMTPPQLISLAAGLFMLPFFLFSATAGQLADKYEKAHLTKIVKAAEILCMGLGAIGFVFGMPIFLIIVLFLMGAQSAFFGPLKYALLPEHLAEDELIGGNALISAGTFIAVLLGTITGGFVTAFPQGLATAAVAVVVFATLGWLASLFIPYAPARAPALRISRNIPREIVSMMRFAAERRDVFLCILGISWFWLVGGAFVSQFPTFAREVIGAGEMVATLFLAAFSIGIGIGALLCNRLLKGRVSATYAPLGALGITIFGIDLYLASGHFPTVHQHVVGVLEFLSEARGIRVFADLVMIAVCGGIFIIPLNALLQQRSEESHRSRTIAANNILNALFMVGSAGGIMLLLRWHFSIPAIFLSIAIVNLAVAFYTTALLPEVLMKNIMRIIFRALYRVEVKGLENLEKAGERVVIVVNHASFIDPPLLATFLPGMPIFAINTQMARKWWVRPFLRLVKVVPMDPTKPLLVKSLIRMVSAGRPCIIFPEGRITVTGSLMKIYEGPGLIADMAGAKILPIRIDGAQYSRFSRLSGKLRRRRLFPKITITVLEPRAISIPPEVMGHTRRHLIGLKLYDVMSGMIFETCDTDRPLFRALLDSRDKHGGRCQVLEDVRFERVDYSRLITGSFLIGRKARRLAPPGGAVGIMMPNSTTVVATFFALHAYGRVPAMINFTFGLKNILSVCHTANITAIITSRSFVEKARLQEIVAELEKRLEVVYIEDMKESMTGLDKARALFRTHLTGRAFFSRRNVSCDDPAAILFTSGSEGVPKGVVLSHRNLLANYYQVSARIDFTPTDVVFNALPVFHSFGLLAGTLLPIFAGIRTFLYPSPLHYRIVPELAYDTNATIMFGTDTFLSGYARSAHPYDFYSIRYIIAGAEKLREETRRAWFDKFGLRILEGYGVTETSPVISINTPMHCRSGTVGRLMPGMEARLEKVPGIEAGGRLYVSGPNVMLGYMLADAPGAIQPPAGGWHDTGDIVEIDGDGYMKIAGRAKRFAKIAGEMVSLGAVEGVLSSLWPDCRHVMVSLPDSRKGEKLVLLTEKQDAAREPIIEFMHGQGCSELMIPALIMAVDSVPVLGSGKIDYVTAREIVEKRLG